MTLSAIRRTLIGVFAGALASVMITFPSIAMSQNPASRAAFTIDALSTTASPVSGGGTVTMIGQGLTGPMSVSFGDVASPKVGPVTTSPSVYIGATDGRGTPHFQKIAGREVSVMNHFARWAGSSPDDFIRFPEKWVKSIHARGVIPMVTWNPTYRDPSSCQRFRSLCQIDFESIISGEYDSYLKEYAKTVKDAGIPIFLRMMHEANGDWYPWNVQKPTSADQYIDAWKHVHDIFEEAGATNVTWVWCPNIRGSSGSTAKVRLSSFYPGDDYVDWVGLDGYNRGTDRSFSQLFDKSLDELGRITDKPVMVAEIGSASFSSSEGREEFLEQTFQRDLPQNYQQVRAVLYFMNRPDVDLSADAASAKAFAAAISGRYYAGPNLANIIDGKIAPPRREDAISVSVPPHPEGTVSITVTDSSGARLVLPEQFTYRDPLAELGRAIGTGAVATATAIVTGATVAMLIVMRRRSKQMWDLGRSARLLP